MPEFDLSCHFLSVFVLSLDIHLTLSNSTVSISVVDCCAIAKFLSETNWKNNNQFVGRWLGSKLKLFVLRNNIEIEDGLRAIYWLNMSVHLIYVSFEGCATLDYLYCGCFVCTFRFSTYAKNLFCKVFDILNKWQLWAPKIWWWWWWC